MSKKLQKSLIKCSFCGSSQNEIDFLVEGDNVFICDLCIEKANEALQKYYVVLPKKRR